MQKILKRFDMFGIPLPMFNIDGEQKVRTYTGCIASLLIMYLTFVFALLKLQKFASRSTPSVNQFVKRDAFEETDVFESAKEGFMMAFALTDYVTGEVKEDPRFIKWFAEYSTVTDGKKQSREVPIASCTQADFDEFYTVERRYS